METQTTPTNLRPVPLFTIDKLNLSPEHLARYGGELYIGGLIKAYNEELLASIPELRECLTEVKPTDTVKIERLKRYVKYFERTTPPACEYGTEEDFITYINERLEGVERGIYHEKILSTEGLGATCARDSGHARARRFLLPEVKDFLASLETETAAAPVSKAKRTKKTK